MSSEVKKIKKIKLSNGQIYSIFDEGALRLDSENRLITGNTLVDKVIIEGNLSIAEVDDVPVGTNIDNVMVAYNVGTSDAPVYQVKKRSTDELLKDIGGISYSMDDATGVLSLNIGKSST